jgi:hypothetical protein
MLAKMAYVDSSPMSGAINRSEIVKAAQQYSAKELAAAAAMLMAAARRGSARNISGIQL